MVGKLFLVKNTRRLCRYPVGQKFHQNRSISHRLRDKCVFAFYAEIQVGQPNMAENYFWGKSPVDYADNLQDKNFVEIALSHNVYEIYAFLCFMQKFKMAAKTSGIKNTSRLCRYPAGQKCHRNRSGLLSFQDIHIFCILCRNS